MGYAVRTWWDERALPRLVDVALGDATSRRWREMVCGSAAGRVLEVGFGSGRNLPFYPPSVTEVLAVEPVDLAWERAADRIARFGRPVRRIGLDGASVALADHSVDLVVSTWTMCTIADLEQAVGEMHRVLRREGTLCYVEHVRSPHPRARRLQERLQPVWGTVAGGCQLDRDIEAVLAAGGFEIRRLSPAPDPAHFELVPFVAGLAAPRA